MEKKACTKCKNEKFIDQFYKCKGGKFGVQSNCKECKSVWQKDWFKQEDVKNRMRKWYLEYYDKNKTQVNFNSNQWKNNNKIRKLIYQRDYYKKNSKRITQVASTRHKIRKETDSVYKMKCIVSSRMSEIFKVKKLVKNKKTQELLGVPFNIAKEHIERQFTKGMNWGNYGHRGDVWHIDHKLPLALAKTEDELIKLCHYTNLQPLWAKDNLDKSDKILSTQMILTI